MYKDVKKRRENQSKWVRENTKGFYVRLSKIKDKDIIDYLETKENKQGFVKELIRREMNLSTMIKALPEGFTIEAPHIFTLRNEEGKQTTLHEEIMKGFDENFKRGLEEGLKGE